MDTTSIDKIITFICNFMLQNKEYVGNSLHLSHQTLNLGLALHNLGKVSISNSIPCSAKIGFAFSKIIACGVFEAPTTNLSSSEPQAANANTDAPNTMLLIISSCSFPHSFLFC